MCNPRFGSNLVETDTNHITSGKNPTKRKTACSFFFTSSTVMALSKTFFLLFTFASFFASIFVFFLLCIFSDFAFLVLLPRLPLVLAFGVALDFAAVIFCFFSGVPPVIISVVPCELGIPFLPSFSSFSFSMCFSKFFTTSGTTSVLAFSAGSFSSVFFVLARRTSCICQQMCFLSFAAAFNN